MKHILYFLAGFIVPTILYCIGAYMLISKTFTLSGETLTERENIIALFFYCILSGFILIAFIAFKQFKAGRKDLGLGISLSLFIPLIFLVKTGGMYFDQFNYYQGFDKIIWTRSNQKPFDMAKTLVKEKTLIGLNSKEVINKLGYFNTTAREDGNTLIYSTDKDWDLYVDLKDDVVVKAYLYQPGMD
jgi:hypothetical protein